jgi:hypothetical protein
VCRRAFCEWSRLDRGNDRHRPPRYSRSRHAMWIRRVVRPPYLHAGIHVKQRAAVSRRRRHDAFVLYGAGHVFIVNNDGSAIAATAREACEMPIVSESHGRPKPRCFDPFSEAHRRHRNGERHKYGTNCCRVSPLFHVKMLVSDWSVHHGMEEVVSSNLTRSTKLNPNTSNRYRNTTFS